MLADVLSYTVTAGTEWLDWPWPKTCKPGNPQLLTPPVKPRANLRLDAGIAIIFMPVHSLKLSNGREWDSYNGFRDGGGPA